MRFRGRLLKCLFDSGSSTCLVGHPFFAEFPELKKEIKPIYSTIRGVNINGEEVQYQGEISLDLQIEDRLFKVKFFYAPQITYGLVLGLDFMNKYGAIVNFNTNTIGLQKQQALKFTDGIEIPAKTSMIYYMPVHTSNSILSTAVIRGNKRAQTKGLLIANAVVTLCPSTRSVPLNIVNVHDKVIRLQKNKSYANLCMLHATDLCHGDNTADNNSTKPKTFRHSFQKKRKALDDDTNDLTTSHTSVITMNDFMKYFDFSNSVLTEDEKKKLMGLCYKYKDCFHTPGTKLKATHLTEYSVKVTDDYKTFQARPYRMSPPMQKEMKKQTDRMIADGWIKRANNPEFISPSLLVQKKNKTWRFVIDYRKINKFLKDTACTAPNPSIAEAIDAVGHKKPSLFCVLDLSSAFTQMTTDAKPDGTGSADKYLNFITPDGIFTPLRAPQGTATVGQRFIETLHKAVGCLSPDHLFLYIDDVILYGTEFDDLYQSVELFLQKLQAASLMLSPSKCQWGIKSCRFLGFILSENGLQPDAQKTEAIAKMPRPKNAKEVKRFNGMVSFYRRFIKDHSKIARCLHELTKPDVKFEWTSECQNAFDELKFKLTNAPILTYARYDRPFILKTDASKTAIGHELLQIQDDGHPHPISYGSRALSKFERNLSVTMKELLSIVWAVKYNVSYLRGTKFSIVTDHAALVPILKGKVTDCTKINRYAIFLSEFNFDIEYISGKNKIMSGADFLSRLESDAARIKAEKQAEDLEKFVDENILPTENISTTQATTVKQHFAAIRTNRPQPRFVLPETAFDVNKLKNEQLQDEFTGEILRYLENGELPTCDRKARQILLTADRYIVNNDVLYRIYDENQSTKHRQIDEMRLCLCLPKSLIPIAVQEIHNQNHQGVYRTYLATKLKYWFPSLYEITKRYVLSCETCAARKHQTHPNKYNLHPLKPARIFERLAIDLIPMIPSKCPEHPKYHDQRWILTCIDHGTRYLEAFMLPNAKSTTIARVLIDEIFLRYGTCCELLSDMGKNLTSSLMNEVCKLFRIHRIFTGPYTPTVNSLLELSNYHLVKTMGLLMQGKPHTLWPLYLRHAVFSLNTSMSQGISFVPYYLVYGRLPKNYVDTLLPDVNDEMCDDVKEIAVRVIRAREASIANLREAQVKMKERFDKTANPIDWEPGMLCFVYFPEVITKDGITKMKRLYSGPYVVLEKVGKLSYKLAHAHSGEELSSVIHQHRMKPFTSRDPQMIPKPDQEQQDDNSTVEANPITDLHPHDALEEYPPSDGQELMNNDDLQPKEDSSLQQTAELMRSVSRLFPILSEQHGPNVNSDRICQRVNDTNEGQEDAPKEGTSDQLYEIDKITKVKYGKGGRKSYLVHWKGYSPKDASYVSYKDLNATAREYVDTTNLPIIGKRNAKKKTN